MDVVDELAWEGAGRPARSNSDRPVRTIPVLIVGAGFSGLAMALELLAAKREFLLIEKGESVGGTWAANRYPGAACDVPSHLYQLERRPGAQWSRSFAPREEIRLYLERVAAEPEIAERIERKVVMKRARWDAAHGAWRVRVRSKRGEETILATHLVLATGMLHVPKRPDIPGLDGFGGTVMHTAEWEPTFEPEGKRVAVIGTGASAIQLVPSLVDRGAEVTLYQRSAPHIVAKDDKALSGKAWLRWKPLRALYRRWLFEFHEIRHMVWRNYFRAVESAEAMSRDARERGGGNAAHLREIEPNHRIGCKRILQSNDYYTALASSAVDLVTAPIERVEPDGVVAGGRLRGADAIALATGFHVADAVGLDIEGPNGSLRTAWAGGAVALGGMHVAGFPNLSVLLGPGTALGHNSMVLMAEAQAKTLVRLLRNADRHDRAVLEPRADAQAAWEEQRAAMASRTVWGLSLEEGGCQSWYHDARGRPTAAWPGTVRQFRRALNRLSLRDYGDGGHAAPSPSGVGSVADRNAPLGDQR